MPKHRLDSEEAMPDVVVFGLSSHVPDYRLCWSLNRAMNLDLSRRRNDIVERARGKDLHYPVFHQALADDAIAWSLIANTCGRRRLLTEQKEADFFLVINREAAGEAPDLLNKLRSAEFVLTAFPLAFSELRNGHKLLL
jgi:hypothetical protein